MEFSKLHLGVDGDSITAGNQWSYHVTNLLGFQSHTNVGVGTAVWYRRTIETEKGAVTTQDYTDPNFAGISDGWLPTEDPEELQKRMNNCAIVHVQRFIEMVKRGEAPTPDVFAFAMGTNDAMECLGDPVEAMRGKSLAEVDTFCEAGAVRWCIQRILEEYPACKVFVLLPLQTANPEHNAKNQKTMEVLRKVAGEMSVQVIDCYHNAGITEKFEQIDQEGRYLRDGLHPNEAGMERHGRYAAMEIRNRMF